MDDPLGYSIEEEIIKQGAELQDFKNSRHWSPLKELMESEVRACFRLFLSRTKTIKDKDGNTLEIPVSEEDLMALRNRAMGVMDVLEMIDGKINDMDVWIARQQKESEKDVQKVKEIFDFNRQAREVGLT